MYILLKNKTLFLFLICFVQFNDNWICNAQTNLVGNGSFEKPHPSQQDPVPWAFGQVYQRNFPQADDKYMLHWETRQKKAYKNIFTKDKWYWVHSPDWFKALYLRHVMIETLIDENGNSSNFIVPANSGRGYIGMMDAELVQQKLEKEDLVEGDDYTVTISFRTVADFWMGGGDYYPNTLDWLGDVILKVWIAKDKIRYKHNNFNSQCKPDNDHFTTPNVDKIEILNKQININDYPPGQWHQTISTFTAPILGFLEEKYKWFIIELIGNDNFGPCNSYLLIDDVALNKECCINECSRTDRCMNPVIGTEHDAIPDGWWFVDNLDNVTQAEIEILNISGTNTIRTYSVSSINGITEPIFWDGKDNNGDEVVPSVYPYSITLTNSCGSETWDHTITKNSLGPTPPPPVTAYNNTGVVTPEPCCAEQPDIYIDNQTLSGPGMLEFVATNNIYIATNGPVTVSGNANVLFQAGNEIIVGTYDYNEEPGAEISKVIVPCPPNPNGKKDDDEGNDYVTETSEEEQEDVQPNDIYTTTGISIHPNPTSGEFTIQVTGDAGQGTSEVYIYDLFGRLIYKSEIVNQKSKIVNISQHPKGIYLVKVLSGEEIYIKKLVHN